MSQLVPQRIIDWSVDQLPKYEIQYRSSRFEVTLYIFRAWGGQRFLNGVEFHGPVYYLGTNEVAKNT